jgi:ATP-dependent Clp protease ATP-binding subunit ClpA
MPWELGRCSLNAEDRHIDVRNVIWIGTSNVGHDVVFNHEVSSRDPDGTMSRNDYLKLIDTLRPMASDRLGVG